MNNIEDIRDEYAKPTPILYTYKGHIEQSLASKDFNNAVDIVLTENINECKQLTFSIPFTKDRKLDHNSLEKLVYFNGIYFIIKEIEEDSDSKDIKVTCEEICTALKTVYCESITMIGETPQNICNAILSATKFNNVGYKWLGTDVPNGVYRHVVTESEISCYENLIALAKVFDGHIQFSYDKSGQGYISLITKPLDTGKFIKKDIEMKSLNITASSKELFTQYYPTGKTDDYGITLDVQSVNGGSSIIKDFSYYQNLGIPDDVIINDPLYNSLRTFNDDTYTDATDLLNVSKQELKKCAQPIFDAEIGMSDFSVYKNSPVEAPKIGMTMRCIDKSIDFIFDCTIVGIERNYNNPMDTKITISNVIKYNTTQQNINHTIDIVNQVTSSSTIGDDGTKTGDGTVYIPGNLVKDGEHINIIRRVGNVQSLIQANFDSIQLRVDDLGKSYSEILQTANSITSTVTSLENGVATASSEIKQTADKISVKVSKGEMGSMIEQNPQSVKVSWNQNSKYCTLDDEEGLQLGDASTGSYSKVGYDGRLSLLTAGSTKPYHCLTWTHIYENLSGDGKDYQAHSFSLPSMFSNIADEDISISVAIAKIFDSNSGGECVQYWSGCYGSIEDSSIVLNVLSTWRNYTTDSNDTSKWIEDFSEPKQGYLNVQVTLIA